MQSFFHYLNNHWVKANNLKISVFDISVLRGFGVFDFLRTYNKKPFRLRDHLDRFANSANQLGLTLPKTKKELEKIIYKGIKKNLKTELNIRLILTGGVSKDSFLPGKKSSLIVLFTKIHLYPKSYYKKGVYIITARHKRLFPGIKSLNYTFGVHALKKAKEQGAVEVLYIDDDDRVLEATTSNIFFVKNNILFTPKTNILPGITKKAVIELAKENNLQVLEKKILSRDLSSFSEAFLTATNKEVMPVVRINKLVIGNGKVGQTTKQVISNFRRATQAYEN